ncbi:MAG: apolipoprotein N-acyltransferase [Bernardetiaceae bacterium]|nr:apolipoprotein N-acyltransferase [Bernardetiaceae bacterium]
MLKSLIQKYENATYYLPALSILGAFFLALSFYRPFQFLLFFALLPLLLIENHIATHQKQKRKRKLLLFVWLMFFLWNLGVTWWLYFSISFGGIGVAALNALLMSLPVLIYHASRSASGNHFKYLAFACFWIGFEYLHLNWQLSFPWLNLGNAFGSMPAWVQWYEYTGALGGTLWVLIANALFFESLILNKLKIGPAFLAVILPLTFSLWVYYSYEETAEQTATVLVVQPNLDCYEEKFVRNPLTGEPALRSVPYDEQITRYIELSKEKITEETDFVVFPETSLHKNIYIPSTLHDPAVRRLREELLEPYGHFSIVTGADAYVFYDLDSISPTAHFTKDGKSAYDNFNTSLFLRPDGYHAYYHKSKLVIGAETNPLKNVLPMKKEIMLFADVMGSMGKQAERVAFEDTKGRKVAPVICYESIYGDFVTEYIEQGAQLILVITNDGWWGNTSGHRQHLYFSSLRAIENRRAVARAANTGISGFIDPRGYMFEASDYDEKRAMQATLPLKTERTFYSKHGDYIGRLAGFLAVFFALSAFVKEQRLKKVRQMLGK